MYKNLSPLHTAFHNAVVNYNLYRALENKNNIQEPHKTWFEADGKMKLLDISEFPAEGNWNIDNFWSDEEKIALGFKNAENQMTLTEFQGFIDELRNDLDDYKEAIECLKQ